jgi:NAD(P)-dependent dehydrogenase (short-subunit alcohol dehydrogenase family)
MRKSIVITGASKGIGRAVADPLRFATHIVLGWTKPEHQWACSRN